ncbi:MAG: DUF3179 domain-containing protein [Acidimicrobiia bacterium]|nr:DUF3179 domain-containing protein [Acidimicrobiia bacterium]
MRRLFVGIVLFATACAGTSASTSTVPLTTTTSTGSSGPTVTDLADEIDAFFAGIGEGLDPAVVDSIGASGDERLAWILADLLRFLGSGADRDRVVSAFEKLSTSELPDDASAWVKSTNLLIERNTAAPDEYVRWKGALYTAVEERWAPFFVEPSSLDYRLLGWGGVLPDDRPFGDTELPCARGCIPALDFPEVTDAAAGDWYPDDAVVFGVTIGDESRAYPKNIMEVHEMVIDRVGGTLFGMPYCTLCGTAAAFDLEAVPADVEPPVLRTSGLLVRSNKVMFDLNTWSTFDMFTGLATSGPLFEAGIELERVTVVTSTWGAWRGAHPNTTIVARDGGIGRVYSDDPLRGRDDDGPIFPVGPVDGRLPVQQPVLGVETPGGVFVAFPVDVALAALESGERVEFAGVVVVADGTGLRATTSSGDALPTSQSFWFAWSQFHPATEIWVP